MHFTTLASLCLMATATLAYPRQATRAGIVARRNSGGDPVKRQAPSPSSSSSPVDDYCWGFPKGLPPLENHAVYYDTVGPVVPPGGSSNTFTSVYDLDTCITICTRERVPCTAAAYDLALATCTLYDFSPDASAYAYKRAVSGGVTTIRSKLSCQANYGTAYGVPCCNAPQTKSADAWR